MNLAQTIKLTERLAGMQPTVKSVVRNDVYRLNSLPDAQYGVFAWLQGEHRSSLDGSLWQFSFTFFYVDRLTFDKANEVEIQSTGIETLENLLKDLENFNVFAIEHTFRTFNERFSDECAGVYCTVTLETPKYDLCAAEYFRDFNNDFNNDFTIL